MSNTRRPLFVARVVAIVGLTALQASFLVRPGSEIFPLRIDPPVVLASFGTAIWAVAAIWRTVSRAYWPVWAELITWVVATILALRGLPAETLAWVGDVPERSLLQRLLETFQIFAWPLAVLVAVIVLRVPIGLLLARVENFQGLGASVNFARGAEDLREDAASLAGDVKAQQRDDRESQERNESRPDGSDAAQPQSGLKTDGNASGAGTSRADHERPRGDVPPRGRRDSEDERNALLRRILDKWSYLEREAGRAVSELAELDLVQVPSSKGRRPSVRLAFRVLSDHGMLPTSVMDLVQRAQQLRNQLVHDGAGRFSAESLSDLLEATTYIGEALETGMERARRARS